MLERNGFTDDLHKGDLRFTSRAWGSGRIFMVGSEEQCDQNEYWKKNFLHGSVGRAGAKMLKID